MAFRRSRDEIDAVQKALQGLEFTGDNLSVTFRTTKEAVRDAIPSEFQIQGEPSVRVAVGRFQSNCMEPFSGAVMSVGVTYKGVSGHYPLIMYMDSDMALLFGRDILSEPKKMGSITLDGDPSHMMMGSVSRRGKTIIRVRAELERDADGQEITGQVFNVRYSLNSGACRLSGTPEVQLSTARQTVSNIRLGQGSLELQGTAHDPVDSFPILEVMSAAYSRVRMHVVSKPFGILDPDDFLPLALGKCDYWAAFSASSVGNPDRVANAS